MLFDVNGLYFCSFVWTEQSLGQPCQPFDAVSFMVTNTEASPEASLQLYRDVAGWWNAPALCVVTDVPQSCPEAGGVLRVSIPTC